MDSRLFSRLHAFFRLTATHAAHACLLGGAVEPTPLNRWAIIGLHARQEISLRDATLTVRSASGEISHDVSGEDGAERLFSLLEQARQDAVSWPEEKKRWDLSMAGGLVGCFSYDFHRWCDSGWRDLQSTRPEAWPSVILCEFEDWLMLHLESGRLITLTSDATRKKYYESAWQALENPAEPMLRETADVLPETDRAMLEQYLGTFERSFSRDDFCDAVNRLKTHIVEGELYQANLSIRLEKSLALEPFTLFRDLCERNPSPFSAFYQWPGGIVVCNSPERLVNLDETGGAQARPIAGTRGRGRHPEDDARIGETLLNNEKERAEHLMLVDLARNDLGRVCRPGSVRVNELLTLERYSHVTHLVSNVVGRLRETATAWDLLRALFPCGTITGCPKIRCVNILNEIEPVSRGFYTGSLGYLDAASSAMDLNILIRSLFLRPENSPPEDTVTRYHTAVHAGAGIVHDAVGEHEYRECLRKAMAGLNALFRMETQAGSAQRENCPEPLHETSGRV